MTRWVLEEQSDGSVVLVWDRRRKSFESERDALGYVKKHRSPTDAVVRIDKDGYTTPVGRRRWRRPGRSL